jgi:hypothetical protein
MQRLPVEHFDGSFVAHEIFAVAIMIVDEVTAIVDVKPVRIFVDGAGRVVHIAIIASRGPAVNAAGSHARSARGEFPELRWQRRRRRFL